MDNALWRFAGAVYAMPGVKAACLELQDEGGVDVVLLLTAAWLGAERQQAVATAWLTAAPGMEWQAGLVEPLRAARRAARGACADPAVDGFYDALKSLELQAEQIRIAILFDCVDGATVASPARGASVAENLAAVAGACGLRHATALRTIETAAARPGP